jgi:hypothetical protein
MFLVCSPYDRLAAAPVYPGLRRFPEGRGYKQWTGNDSKALMKVCQVQKRDGLLLMRLQVIVPALKGLVPDDIVRCFVALLDFAYLARRDAHDTSTLTAMEDALTRFRRYRTFFEEAGVRGDGFSLPRQHALLHYVLGIRRFGSPNGLCSSITESKHIDAVKPWRRSSRHNALSQILRTNTRMEKLAAARIEFGRRGMLATPLMDDAERIAAAYEFGLDEDDVVHELDPDDVNGAPEVDAREAVHYIDVGAANDPRIPETTVRLATRAGTCSLITYCTY